MISIKDFSRRIYERIVYSFEKKRVLYVGVSPKKRDKDYIEYLERMNKLTTMDKDFLVARFGAEEHFILDINDGIPFEDETFDVIIMLGVIGYGLDDLKEIIPLFENEIKRVLKKRGKVFFELSKDKEMIEI